MAEDDQQQNTVYQVAQLKDDNGEDLTNVLVIITQGGAETVDLNSSDQQIVVVNQQEKVHIYPKPTLNGIHVATCTVIWFPGQYHKLPSKCRHRSLYCTVYMGELLLMK